MGTFQNDEARKKVRALTYESFKRYFTVDPTAMTNFSIRLSESAPQDNAEEQALDDRSRKFHSNSQPISEFSDGVQAFVGLIAAILSLEHRIILIDEPEAFLHPSLAYILGNNMTEIAKKRNASLIAATHSSAFLMACISSATDVSVVRLTYNNRIATARQLSSQDLKNMMQDPLLRSTKTLEALFQNAVIISESDTDRAFYDEINIRLQSEKRGINQCLFINGQNKQTLSRILEPLRKVGVPAAAISDLDVFNMNDTNWTDLMSSIGIPQTEHHKLDSDRKKIISEFDSGSLKTSNAIHKIGINALSATRSDAQKLIQLLNEYGLFIIPNGELETWLSGLGVGGHGPEWLVKIFSKLGSDTEDKNYVKPSSNDVWEFMDEISKWTNNPNRKGT